MTSLRFSKIANRRQETFRSPSDPKLRHQIQKLVAFLVAMALATNSLAEEKRETVRSDSGSDLLWKKLETRIEEIADRLDGVMGVAILDLTDGRILLRNAECAGPGVRYIDVGPATFVGSGGKQADAHRRIRLVRQVHVLDLGRRIPARQFGQALAMYTGQYKGSLPYGDNTAANILIDRVGKDNVNTMLRGLGFSKTLLRRKMMDTAAARRGDENVATPQEMARLLEAIYKEKVLSKQATAELIKQLSTKKESYIPRYLSENIQVANKPGELEGVRNDCGIVFVQNRPFIVSVMTAYDRDEKAAERAISDVALHAYYYFEMRGKTSEYGRILSPGGATK